MHNVLNKEGLDGSGIKEETSAQNESNKKNKKIVVVIYLCTVNYEI